MNLKIVFAIAILSLMASYSHAQDELMELVDEPETQEVTSTFKGSRVILGHSVEVRQKKALEFLISHRFGRINSGAHNFWGLDASNIRLGLEYGVTDNLDFGIGRSSYDKSFDTFLKYKVIGQKEGGSPISVVAFGSLAVKTTPREEDDPTYDFNDRLATTYEVLIARKFSPEFSLQIMPVWVHKNRVEAFDKNDQVALGVGGRIKLTQRLALNAEYYYRFDTVEDGLYKNAIAIGFDIETGGHVFQLHFTNAVTTIERAFITETGDDFFDGDIHFGFNISRTFHLGSKEKKDW